MSRLQLTIRQFSPTQIVGRRIPGVKRPRVEKDSARDPADLGTEAAGTGAKANDLSCYPKTLCDGSPCPIPGREPMIALNHRLVDTH